MRSTIPALLLAVLSAMAIPLLTPPAEGAPVLAVFPPGTDAGEAIRLSAIAGGRVVRPGVYGSLYIVQPDPAAATDFQAQLRAVGAWALLDPLFAAGCAGPVVRPAG